MSSSNFTAYRSTKNEKKERKVRAMGLTPGAPDLSALKPLPVPPMKFDPSLHPGIPRAHEVLDQTISTFLRTQYLQPQLQDPVDLVIRNLNEFSIIHDYRELLADQNKFLSTQILDHFQQTVVVPQKEQLRFQTSPPPREPTPPPPVESVKQKKPKKSIFSRRKT